jgi:Permuted papain-like amidase enzyme, YaeF/YiiX, C92 family
MHRPSPFGPVRAGPAFAVTAVPECITAVTLLRCRDIVAMPAGFTVLRMAILARFRAGRILARVRTRLIRALVLYLNQPVEPPGSATTAARQPHAGMLLPGDVLLSEGNTRVAALVKRVTQSSWSHVSMYVGPLDEGQDPRCIVEADIAAGVRSIRLSELNALQVRVLRPTGLNNADRSRLADWVLSRVGSEYDLEHAWLLGRKLFRLPLRSASRPASNNVSNTATRFICCSLLTQAFALVGAPISLLEAASGPTFIADPGNLTPGDFERASIFEVIRPANDTG